MSTVDAHTARELLDTDALFVDVRTPGEFETGHLPGAINLPLDQIDAHLNRIVNDAGGRLILVCQSGKRAKDCQTRLATAGLHETAVLDGGMVAWSAAGGPVVTGRPRWALERQVRLVAGGMVLVSVLTSLLWPPAAALAGLIGSGLTIAALTDSCMMGMALSKLPYNRADAAPVDDALRRLTGTRR